MFVHPSRILVLACLAFISGVGLASMVELSPWWGLGTILVGSFGIAVLSNERLRLASIILLSFGCGAVRVALLPEGEQIPDGQWIQFDGRVAAEPQLAIDHQQLVIQWEDQKMRVRLNAPLHPRFSVDDVVAVRCQFSQAKPFDGFRYDRYLLTQNIVGLCEQASIQFLASHRTIRRSIFTFKHRLLHGVQHVLPLPEQAVLLASLFGNQEAIPQEIIDDFRITATAHLLVVSGLQVVLFLSVLNVLLQWCRIPRKMRLMFLPLPLVIYVVMTGAQPSILRAALCGALGMCAQVFGRRQVSLALLVIVATGLLAVQPFFLLYDAGFQLSFAATAGILLFSKRAEQWLRFLPSFGGLRQSGAITAAATLATFPIIVATFHTVSTVGFFVNIIVAPLVTLLTIAASILAILTFMFPQVASVVAIPLYVLTHLVLQIVAWFASLPFASITL